MSTSIRDRLRALFQTRDLALLWAGQVISMSGDSIYQIALIWLALELTASESITGLVAMSSYLPTLLLALVAGVVADRMDRRRILLIADGVRTVAILGIPLASLMGVLSPWVLVVNAFVIASAAAFFNPTKDAIIPQLVPPTGLLRANSLIQTSWQLALLTGPAIAGILLQWIGLIPLFVVDAGAYAASFITILLLKPQPKSAVVAGDTYSRKCHHEDRGHFEDKMSPTVLTSAGQTDKPRGRARTGSAQSERIRDAWRDIVSGLRYAAGNRVILPLLLITVADNLFIMGPAIVGLPIMVKQTFGGSASDFALMAMAFAIGMLIGTAALVAWGNRVPKGKMLLWGMVADGFTFIPYFFAQDLLQLGLLSVIHGMGVPMLTVSRASLVQEVVPPEMRGRVFSLISLAVVGMSAVSSGLTGITLEWIAPPTLFLIIGSTGGLCGVIGLLFARQLRQER